jgi:hypothetical protein
MVFLEQVQLLIMLKIIKLDRRYNGYKQIRTWLWETQGPGSELDMLTVHTASFATSVAEPWAWQTSFHERRLYIKTDQDLLLFKLKWEYV